jgi:DNA-binding MarR family transcriptional regulator
MQVLVIAVQNAVDYRDLGVATSGATFFRSIGASFGTAVFGAIFTNRLIAELARHLPPGALHGGADPAAVRADPAALVQLPAAVRDGYVQAYASALHMVFLAAVPFALVAFTLTLLLPEISLRETSRAPGAADTYAMPSPRSSLDEIARALSVLAGREGKSRLYERIISRAGIDLDPVGTWLLCHLDRDGPVSVPELAGRLHRPAEDVETRLNRLLGDSLIVTDNGRFQPTAVGQALVEQVRTAEHDTLAELLSDWPPEQRDELADMLTRLVNDLLGHPSDGREVSRAEPQPTAT